ncbi:MFS transporter [Sphaerisporangium sp. NPDC051011]|uniref:MFS transporter n=1 Tax=Sphaerisporangium sp. NPDC051011 TaxID=3155792 RepID=UPI0033C54DE4
MPVLGAVLLAPSLPTISAAFASTPGADVLAVLILTVPALMIALLASLAGVIADKIGRKRLLAGALLLYSVAGVAPVFLDSLLAILATRAVLGVAEAAIFTCCVALMSDYFFGRRRTRLISLQSVVLGFSATVFVFVGGIAGAASWRTPFWIYSIAIVIALAVGLVAWRPAHEERSVSDSRPLEPLPLRPLLIPLGMTAFGGIVFYSIIVQLAYLMGGLGETSEAMIGLASAVTQLISGAASYSIRWLARFGVKRLLPTTFGISAVGLLMVWLAGSVPWLVVGAAITAAGAGVFLPTLLTWTLSSLAFHQRGRASGRWTSAVFLGQFASPLVVAGLGALVGARPTAMGVLGIVTVIAVVALWASLRRRQVASLL